MAFINFQQSCFIRWLLGKKSFVRVQVVTGGGSFADAVPPRDLSREDPSTAFLHQRLVRKALEKYLSSHTACAAIHGQQVFSDITNLEVRCLQQG